MDERTMNGEIARPGRHAERWRPVPWEVISLMLTMVMVGAVVCGVTLAALGEVREDLRALGLRVSAIEQRVAVIEQRLAAIEQRVTTLEQRLTTLERRFAAIEQRVVALELGQARIEEFIEGFRDAMKAHPPASG